MTPIEVVRAVYEAMAALDIAALLSLVHPECVITQDAALPWGGRHVGHEGFANFGLALTSTIDSAVTTEDMFMADGDVFQVGHTRGTVIANGRRSTSPRCTAGPSVTARQSPPTSPSTRRPCSAPSTDSGLGTERCSDRFEGDLGAEGDSPAGSTECGEHGHTEVRIAMTQVIALPVSHPKVDVASVNRKKRWRLLVTASPGTNCSPGFPPAPTSVPTLNGQNHMFIRSPKT